MEIFIFNKFEGGRDGAIGRAFALRVGVQIRAKTDKQVWISLELGDELLSDVPCYSSCIYHNMLLNDNQGTIAASSQFKV